VLLIFDLCQPAILPPTRPSSSLQSFEKLNKPKADQNLQAKGKDDEKDPLLNPAHILVGKDAKNKAMANSFADWMIKEDGGQKVIKGFQKNGYDLYTGAPQGVNPLGKADDLLGAL